MLLGTDLITRRNVPEDEGFILSTWLKSYAESYEARHTMSLKRTWTPSERLDMYYSRTRPLAESLLKRHGATMAVDPESPSSIMGWVVSEARALHYVYVSFAARRMGLATELLAQTGLNAPYDETFMWPYVSDKHRFRPGLALLRPT